MVRWITGFLLLGLGQGFTPAIVQEQIRSSCHPHASYTQLRAAPGPSSVDEDYVTPTKSMRSIGVMERHEGVTSTVSRKGPRRVETLKSAVSFSSIGLDQLPEMELSSKTLQAIKALDKEARLTLVRLADQLQALGTYAASRALADSDLVFRVSLVALAEISALLSQRLLPSSPSSSSQETSDAADEGSGSSPVVLSLKEKLTLVSLGVSPTPSKTDFVMPSFSDAGDTDALVMDMYHKSEQRKTPRFQLPSGLGLPSKASPVLSGVVGLLTSTLTSTASLPLSLVKAADALRGLERTAETRRQKRMNNMSPGGVLKALGKPLVALKRGILPSPPSESHTAKEPASLPVLASRMLSSSTPAPPRLALVTQGQQAVAALPQPMDDFTDRGALSWGHTMEAVSGAYGNGGVVSDHGLMVMQETPFMTLSLPGSKAEDELVIDTKIEVIKDEPSNIEKTVTTAIKVMDMMFVAAEHAAVKVVPEVADKAVLACQRIRAVLQGGAGESEGWELLSALEDGATLAQRSVGGFSDFESRSKGQWRLHLR